MKAWPAQQLQQPTSAVLVPTYLQMPLLLLEAKAATAGSLAHIANGLKLTARYTSLVAEAAGPARKPALHSLQRVTQTQQPAYKLNKATVQPSNSQATLT